MKTDVAVIGGGVVGLSVAYNLAKMGMEKVVVLEKRYLGAGSSGRCAGGIREQFSTEPMIKLARKSLDMYEKLSDELNFNILFRQGGYLFLAYNEDDMRDIRDNVKLQNSLGVGSRIITPDEAKEIFPELNTDGMVGGAFNRRDGVAFPFPVVWGYARAGERLGVEIRKFAEVKEIVTENGSVKGVTTGEEKIECDFVVNAAGGWSKNIYEMAGLKSFNIPVKHEILATEPLKPFLEPMVVNISAGLYFNQSMRGEIIGGIGIHKEASTDMSSSFEFMKKFAKEIVRLVPRVKGVKVLRQWAGLYDMTPDAQPVLGETEIEGFVQANGFSGHGFMLAPVVGELIAKLITTGKTDPLIKPFQMERFRDGIKPEHTVVG